MKKSKNLSLYKILILLIINISIQNVVLFIFSIIFLILDKNKSFLIFIFLLFFIFLTNNFKSDYINIGIVEEKRNNYYVVDKILYKVEVFNTDLEVGDIIITNKNNELDIKQDYLKYNIRFAYNEAKIVGRFNLRYIIHKHIESFDDKSKLFISKVLRNDYVDNTIINVGYGFSFYLLLIYIYRKNKYISFSLCVLYILLFNFDVKLWLIIINFILDLIKVKRQILIE